MRLAYLGTSEFAADVLRDLARSAHPPELVVTPPDRGRGRGRRLAPPPTAVAAEELGIALHQTEAVNRPESVERLRELDLGMVCAFGQLIRDPLLNELELLNVHPSLLPRWRGAAPIERAIMAGDTRTGVTIMRVTAGLDSGPVALQEALEVEPGEEFRDLAARLAKLGGQLAARALERWEQGGLELREQDDTKATYAQKVTPDERRLEPSRPAAELERVVRALGSHVGVHLALEGGARLGVRRASAQPGSLGPGELSSQGDELLLGCSPGVLRLDVVQPPGGRPMATPAYLRGHAVPRLARE